MFRALLIRSVLAALASAAYAEPILPEEAKSRIGETLTVRGLVERVAFLKGNAFLDIDAEPEIEVIADVRGLET